MDVPNTYDWKAYHIEYNPKTNTMRMQFVDANYHSINHFGGTGEFECYTGFKYGKPEAINEANRRNNLLSQSPN